MKVVQVEMKRLPLFLGSIWVEAEADPTHKLKLEGSNFVDIQLLQGLFIFRQQKN